jgi:galactitol-specific phosphotransferase system IIB component
MITKNLAAQLHEMGITPDTSREPCAETDGYIRINDSIHVRVPMYGNAAQVVQNNGGEFKTWPATRDIIVMVQQIEEALGSAD